MDIVSIYNLLKKFIFFTYNFNICEFICKKLEKGSLLFYLNIKMDKISKRALFLSNQGNRISKTPLQYLVNKYARMAGVTKRVYCHLFRVSSITHMSENGCNLEEIRQQSRHADYKTLQGYINMSEEHNREIYLKTLSFDTENENQDEEIMKRKQPTQTMKNNGSTIEQLLATQLANGDITPEIFLEVISKLKKNHENVSIPIYG